MTASAPNALTLLAAVIDAAAPLVSIGQRFGRLTIVSLYASDRKRGRIWLCECECGVEETRTTSVLTLTMRRGMTPMCRECSSAGVSRRNMRPDLQLVLFDPLAPLAPSDANPDPVYDDRVHELDAGRHSDCDERCRITAYNGETHCVHDIVEENPDGMATEDIANLLGMTRQNVHLIIESAIAKMAKRARLARLGE